MARKKKIHLFSPNIVVTVILVAAVIIFVGIFASKSQRVEVPASIFGQNYQVQTLGPAIRLGDTSPLVPEVKRDLASLGYPTGGLFVNDYFNARLQKAIIEFQLVEGLSPTGEIDGVTLKRIELRTTQ